jgi:hypothetical protein
MLLSWFRMLALGALLAWLNSSAAVAQEPTTAATPQAPPPPPEVSPRLGRVGAGGRHHT